MRERIKTAALELFDRNGFYHTGIRDIAAEAGCSLPTLYYHYQSKDLLFEKIVCEAFEHLSQAIDDQLPEGLPPRDTFYYAVMQRRMLSPEEKLVIRLAIKVQMGLDGTEETQARVRKWSESSNKLLFAQLMEEYGDELFARLAIRVLNQMISDTAFGEDGLSDAEIMRELELLFTLAVK